MRPPAFWRREKPSLLAQVLRPAGAVYGAITGRRMARAGMQVGVPVVCVGNFTLGGAGKTPTALALAGLLAAAGERPAFLSRGYGGSLAGPVRVDPRHHGPAEVGDEPLLLARAAPTIVARDRVAGARLAVEQGATVIVMDDGLQNPSLEKDLTLAVVDSEAGIGNGLAFPAGPLRAPLGAQWPRVDALVLVGDGRAGDALAAAAARLEKPVLRGRLEPDPAVAHRLRGRAVLAFAGIGRPQKFFDTVEACCARVVARRAFADHHAFSKAEILGLAAEAAASDLLLVTTEKDHVRLAAMALPNGPEVLALPVRLAFAEPQAVADLVAVSLAAVREDV